ncbi:hypothetical protein Cni_G04709 [Canna indica]|uniref:Uncharacterized protein n=1 Tax=Canna indica TaxID=4628 RepID=A0AAQ3JVW1_9LILI|nr:hypothetical protein Cni_G04709 [Canna indica]
MATAAFALSSLYPRPLAAAGTRPKNRSPRRPPRPTPNLKSRKPSGVPPSYRSSGGGGGEALTYTRLPPKDDFSNDPSVVDGFSEATSSEVRLREAPVPGLDSAKEKRSDRNRNSGYDKNVKVLNYVEEIEEEDEVWGFESNDDFSFGPSLLSTQRTSGEFKAQGGKKTASNSGKNKLPYSEDRGDASFVGDSVFVEEVEVEDNEDEFFEYESEDDELIVGYGSENEVSNSKLDPEFDGEMEYYLDGDEELMEGEVKEKGVPAIMRCFDRAKIYVKAGNGGNGVVAFRREKYVPLGGPSGGDGGKGGNVYVEVDGTMNSLLPFRKNVHFRAGRGAHGQGSKQAGAKGEDVVVKVAPGTVIREAIKGGMDGEVLLELMQPGQRALLLPGGRGGRGNASFKSGTNKAPKIAENGEEGAEMWLDLELKLVADVGIVGAPNAGKSTLLSAISAAQPTIANYPFTTLLPNLGVVSLDFDATMVVADLPGLLEGAHKGFGLGHEFLRHTERCSVLVHVVDGAGQQPEYEFDAVRLELELFSPGLAEKPYIVVYNKMDLPEAYERWSTFKEHLQSRGIDSFCISAMNRQGTHDIVIAAYDLLDKERKAKKELAEWTGPLNLNHVADTIQKQRSSSMNEFEIFHDSSSSTWHVDGAGLRRFVQMTNWQYSESLRRFQHVLEACGVNKSLVKQGVKEGDTVIVAEHQFLPFLSSINTNPSSIIPFIKLLLHCFPPFSLLPRRQGEALVLSKMTLVITIENPAATLVGLLGNILSGLVVLAPMSTFYRIYKMKSIGSYDSVPYVVALFSAMMWVYYGFLTLDVLLLTINIGCCFVEVCYLIIFIIYAPRKARARTFKMILLVNVGIYGGILLLTGILIKGDKRAQIQGGICASFAVTVFAAPLTIIRLVIRTKSVEYMPFSLSFFLTLSAIAWFSYGMLLGDLFVALPNVLGFIFGITQIIIYLMYMNHKKEDGSSNEKLGNQDVEAAAAPPPSAGVELPEKNSNNPQGDQGCEHAQVLAEV